MQLPNPEQMIFFEQAASTYQAALGSDTNAQTYLRGRGFGPQDASTFRLGVVHDPIPDHEPFRGRLAIPYLTPSGVVTFSFRCLENHSCKETVLFQGPKGPVTCKKYRAPAGVDRTLYNVLAFKLATDVIYVCEGELDALTLTLCGYAAVAIPGTQNWKPWFAKPFEDYAQVFCVADGDEAGRKMATLMSAEVKARPMRPPNGEDCNSLYVKGGVDGIRKWLGEPS